MTDWHARVRRHADARGARLAAHAVRELAEHLEDLQADARARGLDEAAATALAEAALAESDLDALTGSALRRDPPTTTAVPGLGQTPAFRSLSMGHALRLAIRQFVHHRSFALVTVLVLGIGLGAAVTVYSIVDGVVLRPLPYAAPDRLVTLWATNAEQGLAHDPISPVNFIDYQQLDVFEDAAAWWRPDVNLVDPGLDPVRVPTIETGANLMAVLGVAPQLGPGFPRDEPYFARQPLVAVISDRLWRTRYGADPAMIGRQIRLDDTPYTVVGVMPPGFDYPGGIDVWQRSTWDFSQHSRAAHFMESVARLAPGVTLAEADAAVTGLGQRLERDFGATNRNWRVRLVPLLDEALGYYRPALAVLFGAVGLLLVIGCLNVASLLLTRALSREREIAVRTALGASPRQLVTQLGAEALVLSVAGTTAGLLVAWAALPLIAATTPVEIPRLAEVSINPRVLGFAAALGIGTTMLFGLVPALVLLRRSLSADLRAGERGSSRGSRGLYRALVVGEVALAAALLAGSGLLIRSVARMTDVPTGVGNPDVVTTSVQIPEAAYPDWTETGALHSTILERLREQPGIRGAGAANFLPLEVGWRQPVAIEGDVLPAQTSDLPRAQFHSASEGYFEAIGATKVSGRFFDARDTPAAPGVVVVNASFARRYLEGRTGRVVLMTGTAGIGPLGRNLMPRTPIAFGGQQVPVAKFEVVGVVADIRDAPLGQDVEPAVYFSARQFPFRSMFLAIDAVDAPTALAALRETLRATAPGIPVTSASTWAQRLRARTAEPRLLMVVLIGFGALAALLASLGVYGLFSWTVALRRRELAIRLTLGARPVSVGAAVVRQGTVLVAIGLVAGWGLVRAADTALSRVLFEVRTMDAASLGTAALVLASAALIACLPPAIRAMRVDPAEGLRID
ncbi:MAG: ABC transporter permease [Vicinamibacterales bacterium]